MYNTDSNYCEVNTLSEDDSVPERYDIIMMSVMTSLLNSVMSLF